MPNLPKNKLMALRVNSVCDSLCWDLLGYINIVSNGLGIQTLSWLHHFRRSCRDCLHCGQEWSHPGHQPAHPGIPLLRVWNRGWERSQCHPQNCRQRGIKFHRRYGQPRKTQEPCRYETLQPKVLPSTIRRDWSSPLFKEGTYLLSQESGGACVASTKNYFLIGTFNIQNKMENGVAQNPGELNKRVESLADNLKKQGYWSHSIMQIHTHINNIIKLQLLSESFLFYCVLPYPMVMR